MGTAMVANASAFAPNYQKGLIAAGKIFQLFNRQPDIVDPKDPDEDKWVNWQRVCYFDNKLLIQCLNPF